MPDALAIFTLQYLLISDLFEANNHVMDFFYVSQLFFVECCVKSDQPQPEPNDIDLSPGRGERRV